MNQHFRNVLSIVGAIVFVFGGLYLVDQYSGWRPFEGRVANAEINGRAGALSPAAETISDANQASNDFSGPREATVSAQKPTKVLR